MDIRTLQVSRVSRCLLFSLSVPNIRSTRPLPGHLTVSTYAASHGAGLGAAASRKTSSTLPVTCTVALGQLVNCTKHELPQLPSKTSLIVFLRG